MELHRTLERQLKRSGFASYIDDSIPVVRFFIQNISDTYTHFDEERELLSRTLDLSSKEFVSVNKQLRIETEIIEKEVRNRVALLDSIKNQFIAIASHEMRTPLAIIRGNAELLLKTSCVQNDVGTHEEVKSILKSVIRLMSIVNDFLDMRNLEDGRITIHREFVDVVQIVRETVADLSTLAREKDITLSCDVPPDFVVPMLELDKSRLQQIYGNVLSNAVHFTIKGGISITAEKQDNAIKIYFKDTGFGMSIAEQEGLFKKFDQNRPVADDKHLGSGLGMYISSILAEAMGCHLQLEKSEKGIGSIFSLTIPLVTKGASVVEIT